MINRIKKLEKYFIVKVLKSLQLIFINPGENKQEKLSGLNPKDILIIEYI
jgi:hypothetical protein